MSVQQPCVLLVEDESAQREVLTYNLEAEGFRVAAARRRVVEVTAGLSTLNTYDASGRRNAVRPGCENFERKA